MRLRDYQADILAQITDSRENTIVQLDTGAGKTPIEAVMARDAKRCIVIAHRNLLIAQISEKLAAMGVEHGVIGTEHTRRRCIIEHRRHGHANHVVGDDAKVFAASVQSIIARVRHGRLPADPSLPWLIIIDEAHHVVRDNMWGSLKKIFANARFIGFTATPARADGRSLSAKKDGIFERLIQAESLEKNSVQTLVAAGFLSPFRVWSIRSDIDESALRIGAAGDYTAPSLVASLKKSQIVGDAVREYKKLASGKRAAAMCVSILNAEETAEEFRAAGIPASYIASTLGAVDIARRIDAFRARELLVLCNVDMIGEGFDLPGIESLIMLRKTASFTAYRQWIGRALRPMEGKPHAIIIDHVGNVIEHGMPDDDIAWSLERAPVARYQNHVCPCSECRALFDSWRKTCPECGAQNCLLDRTSIGGHYVSIEKIDKNLVEVARRKAIEIDQRAALERAVIFPENIYRWRTIGGSLYDLCDLLVKQMVEYAVAFAPAAEINEFLRDKAVQSLDFWIKNFTVKDIGPGQSAKFTRVFKKWQKSKSSAVMREKCPAKRT